MKSYTDLEQSKTLAKILNEETADLWWDTNEFKPRLEKHYREYLSVTIDPIPCWSLAALLGVLKERNDCNTLEIFTNKAQLYTITTSYYKDASWKNMSTVSDNPVDACVEMIVWLKENGKYDDRRLYKF